jgi:hypothetical protein
MLCLQILISFLYYSHILDENHCTLASIVCLKKLFILCSEIITKSKNILVKFTFSICNQQLFFTFSTPYPFTPMMMTSMVIDLQLWIKLLNSLMESMCKNMGINSCWNARIDDTMVIDSIIMTTCVSYFPKPLLNFDLMPKFSTLTKHAFLQMYLYIKQFHLQSDCNWNYSIQ